MSRRAAPEKGDNAPVADTAPPGGAVGKSDPEDGRERAADLAETLPGDTEFPEGGVPVPSAGLPALAALLGVPEGALLAGRAYADRVVGVTNDGRKLTWVPTWR